MKSPQPPFPNGELFVLPLLVGVLSPEADMFSQLSTLVKLLYDVAMLDSNQRTLGGPV